MLLQHWMAVAVQAELIHPSVEHDSELRHSQQALVRRSASCPRRRESIPLVAERGYRVLSISAALPKTSERSIVFTLMPAASSSFSL